jgi:hypothetical protein
VVCFAAELQAGSFGDWRTRLLRQGMVMVKVIEAMSEMMGGLALAPCIIEPCLGYTVSRIYRVDPLLGKDLSEMP